MALKFDLVKSSYQNNSAQASVSVSNKPAKAADDKKDPKDGAQAFEPSGVVEYGTGKAVYNREVFAKGFQDDHSTYNGPAGSAEYSGQTRALEARARWNDVNDTSFAGDGKVELEIDGQAQANLFRSDQGVTYKSPAATYAGHDIAWAEANASGGALVGAQVDGSADLNLSLSTDAGFKGRVGAFAGALVQAQGEARGYLGGASLGVHARGQALAGAQAWAEANVGVKGLHASAGAFAGAAAGGSVGADLMGIGVEATGEAWAGAGAKAGVDAAYKDGKITFSASAGAALGVGAAGGVSVTIDTTRLVKEGKAAWETISGVAGQAAADAGRLASGAYDAAAGWVGEVAREAATIMDGGGNAPTGSGESIGDAAGAVVDAATQVAQGTADAAGSAAGAVADAAASAWDWLTGNG